jgi:hypothetical protein
MEPEDTAPRIALKIAAVVKDGKVRLVKVRFSRLVPPPGMPWSGSVNKTKVVSDPPDPTGLQL